MSLLEPLELPPSLTEQAEWRLEDWLTGVVYIAFDPERTTRVKIGYTTNLRERLMRLKLRPLATIMAGPDAERFLHARFVEHRVPGTKEWFWYEGGLARLVELLRERGEQTNRMVAW